MATWCLKGFGDEQPGWWKNCGDRWENVSGGWHPITGKDTIFVTIRVNSLEELTNHPDYRKWNKKIALEHMLDVNSKEGWIDPQGKWFPCRYGDHEDFAYNMWGVGSGVIENTHIRVSISDWDNSIFPRFTGLRVTKKQENTLLDLGYDPDLIENIGI